MLLSDEQQVVECLGKRVKLGLFIKDAQSRDSLRYRHHHHHHRRRVFLLRSFSHAQQQFISSPFFLSFFSYLLLAAAFFLVVALALNFSDGTHKNTEPELNKVTLLPLVAVQVEDDNNKTSKVAV